ncbi:2OG-Fe(II) oxygenase family protein [Sphingomonas canadensis]|uniref:2OG-Fe(II) oxygenase family protein n=1 Tax=Sphingomonas canadensis TaxID=1219257 RepID=A0ABW3HBE7_9SPHN|nr:2OG-Fe(II) oxygenase family protein [Sphingomonas canadensis]MCW3836278.1 2OG-Fe(II) oxygenase family protein [Sphingomonas canadensis]
MAEAPESIRVRAERLALFETCVFHGKLSGAEAMTEALEAVIRRHMAEHPGLGRSNVGGWHSATDMLAWGGEAAEQLRDTAVRMARRISWFDGRDAAALDWHVRMWANVSPPGALNMSHAHPGVLWAAVYYVAVPGEGGELYLEDPRFPLPVMTVPGFRPLGADGEPQQVEHRILPERGDLILFPAWMRHGVRPHQGAGERISIAMNITVRDPR